MNALMELLDSTAEIWWTHLFHASWQTTLVSGLLLVIALAGRRWPAPLRHGLLLLALLKFAFPPLLPIPTGLFSTVGPAWISRSAGQVADVRAHEDLSQEVAPAFATSPVRRPGERLAAEPGLEAMRSLSPLPQSGAVQSRNSSGPFRWRSWLMLLHLAGSLAVALWVGVQAARLREVRRRARQIRLPPEQVGRAVPRALNYSEAFGALRTARATLDDDLAGQFADLCRQLGLRRCPALMISAEIESPMAFGLLRPTVMLPWRVIGKLPPEEIRVILGHELAHCRRGDLWINCLQLALLVLWWFHPALWLLNRALRKVREDCCDDLLLARGLTSNDAYCDVLLRAARELCGRAPVGATLGFAEEAHPLGRRLARIMDRTIRRCPSIPAFGSLALIVLGCVLLPGLRSQEPKRAAAEPATQKGNSPVLSTTTRTSALSVANAEPFDEQFAKLRWVGENNLYFEEMRTRSQEMGPKAIPFLLSKLEKRPGRRDDGHTVEERRKAIMALGFIGAEAEKVVPTLMAALVDDAAWYYAAELGRDVISIRVSAVAADALGQLGSKATSAIPALMEAVKFGQTRALVALARIAPESDEVLKTLIEALNDNSKDNGLPLEGSYRLTALEALGIAAKRTPAALASLAGALADDNTSLAERAAELLQSLDRHLPKVKELMAEKLERGKPREQLHLAVASARAGSRSDEVYSVLAAALRSENTEFKRVALEGVFLFGSRAKQLLSILTELIQTETGVLQARALRALAHIGKDEPGTVSTVIQNLSSPELEVRREAFSVLPSFGKAAQAAEPILLDLLSDSNAHTRQQAAAGLGMIGASPEKAVPALRAALQDSSPYVQSSAMQSLGKFGEAGLEFLPVMIEMVERTNAWWGAVSAIGDLGPLAKPAVPVLMKALRSPDDGLRNNAANALGRIGSGAKAAIPALETLANDKDSRVRRNALFALWKIDGRTDIIRVLIDRLESDDKLDVLEQRYAHAARLSDVYWLGQIGPAAKAAVPVLEKLRNGAPDNLREAIGKALGQIRSTAPAGEPKKLGA